MGKEGIKKEVRWCIIQFCYDNKNSSEVWDGFRVAERAKVSILKEDQTEVVAEHNGYKKEGMIHYREFKILSNGFYIKDLLKGDNSKPGISSIHFSS